MLRRNFPGNKQIRRDEAEKRKVERETRSNKDQLKRLDDAGLVATRERARLAKETK